MSAPDRDAVYEGLRKQGIRAIRVDEIIPPVRRGLRGLRRRDWLILATLALLLSFAVMVISWRRTESWNRTPQVARVVEGTTPEGEADARKQPSVPTTDLQDAESHSEAYLKIAEEVESARESYRKKASRIDYELLANYALVERVQDMSEFRSMISYGREVVSNARDVIRQSYSNHYGNIPDTFIHDMDDAQRLYGLAMEELDVAEERLECDDCALVLLDMNRGQWHVVKGTVMWKDARLERQFRIFGREQTSGKTRWERDFGRMGPKSIESEPIEVPTGKLHPGRKK